MGIYWKIIKIVLRKSEERERKETKSTIVRMSVSDTKKHMVAVRKIVQKKIYKWLLSMAIQFATKREKKNGKFTAFEF